MIMSAKHNTFLPGLYQAAIRTSLAASLALTVSSAKAQVDLKAPVNIAFGLYAGCIRGTIETSRPKARKDIKDFIESLDNYCLQWTVIWYSTQKDDLSKWPMDRQTRFNDRRVTMLQSLGSELVKVTPK